MATGTCSEYGTKLGDNLEGTIYPKSELMKSDWKDFETHKYSRQELARIPLGLHLGPLARVCVLYMLTISLLSVLGGLFVGLISTSFIGMGLLLGFSCGAAISKSAWRSPTPNRYKTLYARRKGKFALGALIFGAIGGLAGICIPAAAQWTIDFGSGSGWREAGVAGRAIPGLIGVAVLVPIIGVVGASVVTFISERSNKNSYLSSFDDWQKTTHPVISNDKNYIKPMDRNIATKNKESFYGLQPRWLGGDRLYHIFITSRAFCGAKVAGQFYDEQSAETELNQLGTLAVPIIQQLLCNLEEKIRIYDAIDPMSSAFLEADKTNFRILKEEVRHILINRKRSWWTASTPNSGTIKFVMLDGKTRKFILIGIQDVLQIKASAKKLVAEVICQ